MNFNTLRLGACTLALLLAGAGASAQPASQPMNARLVAVLKDSQLLEQYARIGQKVSQFCANCHGAGGNSVSPDTPNLAGQNPAYLLGQLHQFAVGRRRYEFMERLIRAMSEDEKLGVAVFYAGQSVQPHPSAEAALVAEGKRYYDKVCWRCHGTDGHGSDVYARIAGQRPDYLQTTLLRYRSGTGARTNALMSANTRLMSDADIRAVVAYVSSMR